MEKLQKLADRLQASIDFATKQNEDFEASSWNYQEGVLLNHNEAKLVVDLVKNLAIHVVSDMLCGSFDADNSTSSATKCKCGREKWEHPKPRN